MVTDLEFGSMALSLSRQYPESLPLSWFSLAGMSFSNAAGAYFAVWYARNFEFGSVGGRWALTVIGLVLMALRQETEARRWYEVHVTKKSVKDRTA